MISPGEWVTVARVRSVQAQRREVRLDELPPYAWLEPAPEWVRFAFGGGAPKRLKLAATLHEGNSVVLVLAAGVPRETVSALKGVAVVVPEAEANEWRADGWYPPEWRGYTVRDGAGAVLGLVREVWDAPANAAFTVESDTGERWILPAVDAVVLEVDRDAETLTITGFDPHGVREDAH